MNMIFFWAIQIVLVSAYVIAYWSAPVDIKQEIRRDVAGTTAASDVVIPRVEPLVVEPLYDRPEMVSDEDLAAVLWQVRPKFSRKGLRPNLVEHAIRAWSVDAEFRDPDVLSGAQMQEFLLDHGTFLLSWDQSATPLLGAGELGVKVNWGVARSSSVHHDHMLACVTEAGTRLDAAVYLPSQQVLTLEDVLREALRDFRIDERETEWTAMAFGLWLPPTRNWRAADGREMSFDLLAERLIRGRLEKGVCSGTHRVYSLMLLWRLDEQFDILTDRVADHVYAHLADIRDRITASQFEDGHWPSNWDSGAKALINPRDDELKNTVIATGHHLEWLAIAPESLHPPREQIDKAAEWIIETVKSQSADDIFIRYTFFSHVGNALALWRGTHPAEFWREWQTQNPEYNFAPAGNKN